MQGFYLFRSGRSVNSVSNPSLQIALAATRTTHEYIFINIYKSNRRKEGNFTKCTFYTTQVCKLRFSFLLVCWVHTVVVSTDIEKNTTVHTTAVTSKPKHLIIPANTLLRRAWWAASGPWAANKSWTTTIYRAPSANRDILATMPPLKPPTPPCLPHLRRGRRLRALTDTCKRCCLRPTTSPALRSRAPSPPPSYRRERIMYN